MFWNNEGRYYLLENFHEKGVYYGQEFESLFNLINCPSVKVHSIQRFEPLSGSIWCADIPEDYG